jgi:predicted lipase
MLFIVSILHQLLSRLYIYTVPKVHFDYFVENYHYPEYKLAKEPKVRRGLF